ncbi:MAG: hypothetical protein LUH55_09865 [Bacteroides thetaiotaomicron]|nr:hypothetical protein [Bacteroides thetaiotaomicron]
MTVLVGIAKSPSKKGGTSTTLYCLEDFKDYYKDTAAGRSCEGMCCESVYAGGVDCSHLKIGAAIEISYDKAITLPSGQTFQQVKRIDVLSDATDLSDIFG